MVGAGLAAGRRRAAVAGAVNLGGGRLPRAAALHWPELAAALLLDRPAVAQGQWWRLWSGHLLHLDLSHALLNLGALAVILMLAWRQRMLAELAVAALVAMPLLSLALLWLDPQLDWYAGLSGLLHGLLVMVLVRRGDMLAIVLLLLLVAKLACEWRFGSHGQQFEVVTLAHRLGAALGVLWAVVRWRAGNRTARG